MEFVADLQMIPALRGGRLPLETLNAVEKHLLGLVDGNRTVAELGVECGFGAEVAGKMVGKLLLAGILIESTATPQVKPSEPAPGQSDKAKVVVEATSDVAGNDETAQGVTEDAIVKLYAKLENSNYYELLNVTPVAERSEIRAAYFSLSKKFHPDSVFRHGSAELKQQLSRIFDKLTTAYETLSGKSKRQAYDQSIASEIDLWKLEHSLGQSVKSSSVSSDGMTAKADRATDASQIAKSGESNKSTTSRMRSIQPTKPSTTSYRRTPVQDDVSVGMGARVSRIPVTRTSYTSELQPSSSAPAQSAPRSSYSGGMSHSNRNDSPPTGSVRASNIPVTDSMSPEEREARRRQWKQERLKKAMQSGNSTAAPAAHRQGVSTTMTESEVQLIEHARIAIEHHEFDLAIQNIQEVLKRDGENTTASKLLRQAQSGKVKADINDLIRRGRFEQSSGNYQAALELYERAYTFDIRNLEAKYHIASVLLEMQKDLRRAIQLCHEVVGMGGRKPQYFVTLADLYELIRDRARAIESLQRAVSIAPEDRELKKRLKSMTRK